MTLGLTIVDAFTSVPFAGNPAAVAIVDAYPDDSVMQAIAGEMNLSETAFVMARGDGEFDLRWFTPTVEVDLCGHATLAAAHVLGGTANFHSRSGRLECTSLGDGRIGMDFPADPPMPAEVPEAFELPGLTWFGRGRWAAVAVLDGAHLVRSLVPDLRRMAMVGGRAVIVSAAGDRPGIDCVSRVFAPNAGIPEDPVTGSAHCTLSEYWGDRLGLVDLVGEQASPRGGMVTMRRCGERVVLGGQAVTVGTVQLAVLPESG